MGLNMRCRMATKDNKEWAPNIKQRKAAELLADPEWRGTITELCLQVGVDRTTYYKWIAKPKFNEYVSTLIDRYMSGEYSRAWKALMRKIDCGDTKAIRLFFELQKRVNSTGSVTINFVDDVK